MHGGKQGWRKDRRLDLNRIESVVLKQAAVRHAIPCKWNLEVWKDSHRQKNPREQPDPIPVS
jgi:hypothetical protein